jgi:hypothetical protein
LALQLLEKDEKYMKEEWKRRGGLKKRIHFMMQEVGF